MHQAWLIIHLTGLSQPTEPALHSCNSQGARRENLFFGERKGRGAGVWSFGCEFEHCFIYSTADLGTWMVLSISPNLPCSPVTARVSSRLCSSHSQLPPHPQGTLPKEPGMGLHRSTEALSTCAKEVSGCGSGQAVTPAHGVSPSRDELSLQLGSAQLCCLLPHHFTCTRWISLTLHNHLGYQS